MPKAEWGTKRLCAACGARFYDLGRSAIVCPACDAPFDLENAGRTRRGRGGAKAVAETEAEEAEETKETVEPAEDDEEEADEVEETTAELDEDATGDGGKDKDDSDDTPDSEEEGEEDQSLIEDASELGDDDPVSDVIDGDIDKSETRE